MCITILKVGRCVLMYKKTNRQNQVLQLLILRRNLLNIPLSTATASSLETDYAMQPYTLYARKWVYICTIVEFVPDKVYICKQRKRHFYYCVVVK